MGYRHSARPAGTDAETVVVVGASAGGVEALQALVRGLPADLPAAVLVVLHLPRSSPSVLPGILSRGGPLPATHATDGDPLRAGTVLVAPPNHHLLVIDGRVHLSHGPAENGHRPAIDPTFRSAARMFGTRTVAVVLSGARDDGTSGAATVAEFGGVVIAQDPAEALHPSMPASVLSRVPSAISVPGDRLGATVADIVKKLPGVGTSPGVVGAESEQLVLRETAVADMLDTSVAGPTGDPAGFGCPDCHGALFELPGEPAPRFRCRVGHAWSPDSLLDEQGAALEGALWMALRSLEEKQELTRRMAEAARLRGHRATADRYDSTHVDSANAVQLIRALIGKINSLNPVDAVEPTASGWPR